MKFTVEHETSSSMRIRMAGDKPSKRTGDAICAILSRTAGIHKVRIYPATKGLMIRHSLSRDALMGIRDIYEIMGDYANAAKTCDRLLDLLEQEWGFTEETDSSVAAAKKDKARLLAKA